MWSRILLAPLLAFSLLVWLPAPVYLLWKPEIVVTEVGHFAAILVLFLCFFVDRSTFAGKSFVGLGGIAFLLFLSPSIRAFVSSRSLAADLKAAFDTEEGWSPEIRIDRQDHPWMASRLIFQADPRVRVQRFSVPLPTGQSLPLDLYLPPGATVSATPPSSLQAAASRPSASEIPARKRPCLVVIHGGSWQGGDLEQLPAINSYFAARGVIVAAVTYRLAPKDRFPAQIDDLETNLRWLQERADALGLDRKRIVLLGRSAGGHLALLTGYRAKIPGIQGVISFYGPTDLHWSWQNPTNPWVYDSPAVLRDFLGGSPREVPAAYDAASPIRWVRRSSPPTLLIHGAKDGLVSIHQSRRLAKVLRSYQIRHFNLELPWATHACEAHLYGPSGQVSLFAIERFLASVWRERLDGASDRWRALPSTRP